jgi:hypothetical protein
MIQGCRYLRRSTDRWTLSKNSTTRLKDLKVWRKAGLLWECANYNYIHPGFIFIPCRGMTPGGLRAQYLIPNLMPKCECLSIHSSLPLRPRHHAISQNQRKQSLCRTEANCRPRASLPNLFEETFLLWTGFSTKLDPQIRLPPVPNFGVNRFSRHSAMKSTSACDLMAVHGLKSMLRAPSSTAHLEILPVASWFRRMSPSG